MAAAMALAEPSGDPDHHLLFGETARFDDQKFTLAVRRSQIPSGDELGEVILANRVAGLGLRVKTRHQTENAHGN